MSRRFQHAWGAIACWLPEWSVRWYWHRQMEHQFERMRRWAEDPVNIERIKAMPATYFVCRTCGKTRNVRAHECAEEASC